MITLFSEKVTGLLYPWVLTRLEILPRPSSVEKATIYCAFGMFGRGWIAILFSGDVVPSGDDLYSK